MFVVVRVIGLTTIAMQAVLTMEPPVIIIIYADDAVRSSMQFLLEAEGWSVQAFRSPSQFLQSLTPSCLILEQNLPGVTGLELIQEIRRRGFLLPAILTTTLVDPRLTERVTEAGATIVDALSTESVIAAVNAAIAGDHNQDAPASDEDEPR